MAIINHIEGVRQVLENLKKEEQRLGERISRALKIAGLTLQRASQEVVPVHFGVLKASAFTRSTGSGYDTVVTVGYTASYAIYVHEAVGMVLKGQPRTGEGAKGRYWDPQGKAQAKFLEEPARRLAPELTKIIRDAAKV